MNGYSIDWGVFNGTDSEPFTLANRSVLNVTNFRFHESSFKPTIAYKSLVDKIICFIEHKKEEPLYVGYIIIDCQNFTDIDKPSNESHEIRVKVTKNLMAIFGPIDGLYIVLYSDENKINYCFSDTKKDKRIVN